MSIGTRGSETTLEHLSKVSKQPKHRDIRNANMFCHFGLVNLQKLPWSSDTQQQEVPACLTPPGNKEGNPSLRPAAALTRHPTEFILRRRTQSETRGTSQQSRVWTQPLHSHCTTTAQPLHCHCTPTAPQLHSHYTATAPPLHCDCTATGPRLHSHRTATAL